MESPILSFLLLVLRIPLKFYPDFSHKSGRFSEALLQKGLQFVTSRRDGTIACNLDFVLLPGEVDFIPKERSRKEDALEAYNIGRIKTIIALSTEVVLLHVGAIIV